MDTYAPFGGMFGQFGGIKLVESEHLIERIQTKFPRTKRKRIQKKWMKQSKNYSSFPSKDILKLSSDTWVCHPLIAKEIRRNI